MISVLYNFTRLLPVSNCSSLYIWHTRGTDPLPVDSNTSFGGRGTLVCSKCCDFSIWYDCFVKVKKQTGRTDCGQQEINLILSQQIGRMENKRIHETAKKPKKKTKTKNQKKKKKKKQKKLAWTQFAILENWVWNRQRCFSETCPFLTAGVWLQKRCSCLVHADGWAS